jgi:hypothetical protein
MVYLINALPAALLWGKSLGQQLLTIKGWGLGKGSFRCNGGRVILGEGADVVSFSRQHLPTGLADRDLREYLPGFRSRS